MKKFLASILTLALCLGLATGCAGKQTPAENDTESAGETGVKEIPSLKIAFSPYADADQITTATEPLEQLLQAKLLEKGYDVKDIDMTVGTSYTAVGEALRQRRHRLHLRRQLCPLLRRLRCAAHRSALCHQQGFREPC